MKLFEKMKNKLGIIALVGLLFQLVMPIYQVYVFAQENTNIETVQAASNDSDKPEVLDEIETELEDRESDEETIPLTNNETESEAETP